MAILIFFPITLLYLLFFPTFHLPILAINVTDLLIQYPNFTDFTNLLISTGVAADVGDRSSITLLAVPNSFLRRPSDTDLADALRYHVLLEGLSWSDLRLVPPSGRIVATLFQATGRAAANYGTVNITLDPASDAVVVGSFASNATVLSLVRGLSPNNKASIFSISSLLMLPKLDLMDSETSPPAVNITKALTDGHDFNVVASMLAASGVATELEGIESGAGLTLFMPTDAAFSDLPPSVRFPSFPAEKKSMVLRFHVLHSYYPLGSLESIVNPVQPTLATEYYGAGSFTLNISKINGSVAIDSGKVQASVTQTVFDQNPVSIFGVSKVLLPKEYFGSYSIELKKHEEGGEAMAGAQPPNTATSPGKSPDLPSHATSPSGLEATSAAAAMADAWKVMMVFLCFGFYYYVVLL